MVTQNQQENSAEMLLGLELEGGWKVIDRHKPPTRTTGGRHSIGYIVESDDGRLAFLKALDYSAAFQHPDTPRQLQAMTSAFNYERDLLDRCARMNRIVTALADGTVYKDSWKYPVNYLIFEWAEKDSRTALNNVQQFDIAWCLRTLHHVAVGLQQLHYGQIAHQDIKPSNVLIFDDKMTKIADLGRASLRGHTGPFDELDFPGDKKYAPPELLYEHINPDWVARRLASDMYQLGSLIMFFFTRVGTTASILTNLDPCHSPAYWSGTFPDVLPYVQQAFILGLNGMKADLPNELKDYITRMISELCEPDPEKRGHPINRTQIGNEYGLERYITRLNLFAKKIELKLISIG